MRFIAKTFEGLEPALAKELELCGANEIKILTRAVSFEGELETLYRANIQCRTALNIISPISEVKIEDEEHLYKEIYSLPWHKIFSLEQTFAVKATVSSDVFTHSKYVALKSKDAIVDKFRRVFNQRPNVNPVQPQFIIDINIRGNIMTISLDSTGELLYKRGYRINPVEAPMNEVLAAGVLLLSNWDGTKSFWDPMCGSGTLVIEAAKIAGNIPPQKRSRRYNFQNWKNYDSVLFNKIVEEVYNSDNYKNIPPIYASDKSLQAVNAATINIQEAELSQSIEIKREDFFRTEQRSDLFILTNPPYDERLKHDNITKMYQQIGDHLKQKCLNTDAWIFSGNHDAIKSIGLKPDKKINLKNGPLEAFLYKYEIYEGSKN